ncbi:MFS multidrug transporter [Purpureocillium lavendulum]|uniref:MFS multidrug transporter n=1 Tax=Purpureocillium lavendulum TaxID=1247861 RepID=A0AB34FEN8_9HYPO|nr:MFS multidrug transporter [Purpureocillium lavendulum]
MKLEFGTLLLASALGGVLADLLPELKLADMQGLGSPTGNEASVQSCPPGYPRKCPLNNLCCYTSKCCQLSCCKEEATFCYNGHCYA